MIKTILDKLWKAKHKVNNKLDGYWYVRLADVTKILEQELEKNIDDRYKDQEYSQDIWNRGLKNTYNPNRLKDDE
tara:strand:- start:1225 stop:1449 length:225 start_codon:yes stop_codon:yes gene_type:complete